MTYDVIHPVDIVKYDVMHPVDIVKHDVMHPVDIVKHDVIYPVEHCFLFKWTFSQSKRTARISWLVVSCEVP